MKLTINLSNFSISDIWITMIMAAVLISLLCRRKKGYVYNTLDKTGVVFNIVLSIIYVYLSIAGLFTLFFWDDPSAHELFLLDSVTSIGFSIPFFSILSIFTSVIARKRGKSKFSFIIQFLPILVFIIMLILISFMFRV